MNTRTILVYGDFKEPEKEVGFIGEKLVKR